MNHNLYELEMAKKRDHKIIITEEAINKIPRIKYREIPESEYDNLWDLAKNILKISKEENDSNEVAITYSLDSAELIEQGERYIAITFGDEHNVDPLSDTTAYHLIASTKECVLIVLHNHPSLSDFSLTDVQFLLRYDSVKMMVVVTNLGSISYLVKSKKYDWKKAIALFNEAVDKNNKAEKLKDLHDAANYFLKNSYKIGIEYNNR
ncbi:MAG: hypothetical protein NC416_08470 [Eubacterium sp.]|nr:hypothetical protein [Eubacterium sp.]